MVQVITSISEMQQLAQSLSAKAKQSALFRQWVRCMTAT